MARYRGHSYGEYLRAMELLKDHGPTEVCRILGWPTTRKSLLHYWKHEIHKPSSTRWIPEPSNELAYVIGVLYGDGSVINEHGYHYDIELLVKDREFAEAFSRAMAKLLDKKYMEPEWSKPHKRWRVYYSSKAFHTWYRKQTLDRLKKYIEHDKYTVAHSVRGLYDSEGCNYRCKRIIFYNNDIKLLYYVKHLLKKYFGIIATGPYLHTRAGSIMERNGETYKRRGNTYSIAIYKRQHVKRFLNEIRFSITRKQQGLPRRK